MFQYDMTKHNSSPNIMDKWVLASLHALIKFVNEEMAGVFNFWRRRVQLRPITDGASYL